MKGLIEEGSEILKEDGEDAGPDAGIIVAAQRGRTSMRWPSYGSVRTSPTFWVRLKRRGFYNLRSMKNLKQMRF